MTLLPKRTKLKKITGTRLIEPSQKSVKTAQMTTMMTIKVTIEKIKAIWKALTVMKTAAKVRQQLKT